MDDPIAVNELTLYAENDVQLYYQRIQPIIKNYARKMLRHVYDETLAIKGFMYVVNDALKKYNEEFGELRLTKEEKEEVAKNLLDHYMDEIKDTVDQISIGRVEKASNEDDYHYSTLTGTGSSGPWPNVTYYRKISFDKHHKNWIYCIWRKKGLVYSVI